MGKWIKFRLPKLRITSKGVRITKPSARIGGAAGLNVSSKGVSASVRTGVGTINSKRGLTLRMPKMSSKQSSPRAGSSTSEGETMGQSTGKLAQGCSGILTNPILSVRGVNLSLLGMLVIACVCCFAYGMGDRAIRSVGLLPTYTPRPTATPKPTATAKPPTKTPWATQTPNPTPTKAPTATPGTSRSNPVATAKPGQPTATPAPSSCYQMQFMEDVTVPDGSHFQPGEKFVKTWRVRNVGKCAWQNVKIQLSAGDAMGAQAVAIPDIISGASTEINLDMVAPETPGNYRGTWTLQADDFKFGQLTIVIISGTPVVSRPTPAPTSAATRPTQPAQPVQPTQSAPAGGTCDCSGDTYNCSSFNSHSAAQSCFDYCVSLGRGDIHKLDQDNNGTACESLP